MIDPQTEDVSMLAEVQTLPDEEFNIDKDTEIPILTLRNMVLFPTVVMPVTIGRKQTLKLIEYVSKHKKPFAVMCQKKEEVNDPGYNDLYCVGTIARVLRTFELPNGNVTAILQSMGPKVFLNSITNEIPFLWGTVSDMPEVDTFDLSSAEDKVLLDALIDISVQYIKQGEDSNANEAIYAMKQMHNPKMVINFICSNLPIDLKDKINLLKCPSIKERAYSLLKILNRNMQLADIKKRIQMRTRMEIDNQQKEYFLQQQIKNIQEELGNGPEEDIDELENIATTKKWSNEIKNVFYKELKKLERLNPQAPDYSVQYQYLQTMLALPWNIYTTDNLNLKNAEKILDKEHYGLEKVKERILEHLAVLKLKQDMKSPIICLYGPPGVGKTSLGKSIASALKRKYVRMSLGGVHDEAEIRGHRRTYIGAMPGRIIKGLLKAESANPVMILDEIDKLGNSMHGDPSSAMLEVLDPEQNMAFHDNYLDLDFDLSKVMFIATANNLATIPAPLRDRMEIIEINSYITEEKIEIARKHLIPKEMEAVGLPKNALTFPKKMIEYVIENYTRESGVRELEHKIAKIMRKVALKYARNEEMESKEIRMQDIHEWLGKPEFVRDEYQGNEYAGVVTGLAWTAVGGEILFIETSLNRSKGGKLTLTGNLGDVMKESAMLAVAYLKAHCNLLNVDPAVFENWDIHIHVPEGATPKDGPSAGITMVTSLASALTQRKVKDHLAMTGEISLRGKVLPVGGIKEKILAAKRAGIKEIILCEANRKDIEAIQPLYLKGLTFHFVNDIQEVLKLALTDQKVKNAIDLNIKADKEDTKN